MRISDWSSDVCSSDLILHLLARELALTDPAAGTTLRVTAPLPPHMAATWRGLRFDEDSGEGTLQALLAYAEGLSHSPARGQRPLPAKGGDRKSTRLNSSH